MNIGTILAGIAAIPQLIARIDQLLERVDRNEKRKWMQISTRVERKLSDASSPEEIKNVALEIKRLIDES